MTVEEVDRFKAGVTYMRVLASPTSRFDVNLTLRHVARLLEVNDTADWLSRELGYSLGRVDMEGGIYDTAFQPWEEENKEVVDDGL